MKRLNPITGLPFQQGDVREDGFIFREYNLKHLKKDGFFAETWCSSIVFKKHCDAKALWQKENPDRINAIQTKWRNKNPDKNKAKIAKWHKQNRSIVNAINAKYRAAKLQRTPAWLTSEHFEQIKAFYALAKSLEDSTGIVHHVDHIVPLQGDNVSGLHVPWNLQVLTASENCSKNNYHAI